MHTSLAPLPSVLLSSLGRADNLDALTPLLGPYGINPDKMRQHQNGKPYSVSLPPYGIDLTLQCTNSDATQDQWQWGLHSFTLYTAAFSPTNHWTQPWPQGLDPEQARAADVVRLLAVTPEEAMATPTLVCFAIDGLDGLTWALLATFDSATLKLQTLSLQRSGEWLAAGTVNLPKGDEGL